MFEVYRVDQLLVLVYWTLSLLQVNYYWKYDNLVEFLMWLEISVIEMICLLVIVITFFNITVQ